MINDDNNLKEQDTIAQEDKEEDTIAQEVEFTQEDIEKNKTMAGLAYILFFLPLIVCPDSSYAKFHANQGLLLLIVSIAGNIILGMIPIIGWILLPLFGIVILVFAIMGLVNGLGGKAKRLPLIGKYTILK
jgi:uncharacterized membrane protein